MSSVINPVGPEEPSTYWRRRAVVLVALLALLWVAWLVIRAATGGGDDAAAPGPSPSGGVGMSASPSTDASGAATPTDGGTGQASGSPTASATSAIPSPSAASECPDAVIEVAAGTAAPTTGVGAGLGLTMTVTNTGTTACSRDVGAGANELRILSGGVRVWSSDHCNPSEARDVVLLAPGEQWSTSMTWPGTTSQTGCADGQSAVGAGEYSVVARNGSVRSQPEPFVVQ